MPKIVLLKRSTLSGGTGLHVSQDLVINLDTAELAQMVGEAVREEAVAAIESGLHGDVGGRPRGLDTGRLRDSIAVVPGSSGGGKATVTVKSMAFDRQDFLAAEASRGVNYISANRAAPRVREAIAKWKSKILKG